MAVSAPPPILSANDARVLNALFDPETLPSSVAKSKDASAIDSSLPPHPSISASKLTCLEREQDDIVRQISSNSSIQEIRAAITELDRIVRESPDYASAYVNRAMLLRLELESQVLYTQHIFTHPTSPIQPLFRDLARAIHLSLPSSSSASSVSPYQAKILRAAYSHRAYLYLKAAETGTSLQGLGKAELEELASKDFAGAAKFGDNMAREMSVRTNPYAKMCGAIVRNALKEEMSRGGV
ncbi:hypothetical protein GQ44DRAFT_717959 [Phaeosphaeriaceae sp. PMI808]|nr:hypothetical protein GQ44DRAFT_717959 [Phaeosphaeriaceae sp. PMI808]